MENEKLLRKLEEERIQKIKKRFPEQFGKIIDRFGISLPFGWLTLFENTCVALNAELNNYPGVKLEWTQLKEKFGLARFYFQLSFTDDYGDQAVESITKKLNEMAISAENVSGQICQDCGKPGKMRGGNWLRTLCDEHAKERGVL